MIVFDNKIYFAFKNKDVVLIIICMKRQLTLIHFHNMPPVRKRVMSFVFGIAAFFHNTVNYSLTNG